MSRPLAATIQPAASLPLSPPHPSDAGPHPICSCTHCIAGSHLDCVQALCSNGHIEGGATLLVQHPHRLDVLPRQQRPQLLRLASTAQREDAAGCAGCVCVCERHRTRGGEVAGHNAKRRARKGGRGLGAHTVDQGPPAARGHRPGQRARMADVQWHHRSGTAGHTRRITQGFGLGMVEAVTCRC